MELRHNRWSTRRYISFSTASEVDISSFTLYKMTTHTRTVQEADIHSDGGDIDLSDPELEKAVEGVRAGGTQWAVIGYQGNTPSLKVPQHACADSTICVLPVVKSRHFKGKAFSH